MMNIIWIGQQPKNFTNYGKTIIVHIKSDTNCLLGGVYEEICKIYS